MKKFVALVLAVLMMAGGTALATGRALPQESTAESTYEIIDCFDLAGMSREEVNAYLEERGRQLFNVQLSFSQWMKDGEMVQGFNGIYANGGGIGAYGLSVNGQFDGELNEAMIADGWEITSRQFEGGYWYNRLSADEAGYTMYIQTDGSKIMYMEFKISNLFKYMEARLAEESAPLE